SGASAPGDQVSSIEPRFDPMRLIVGSEGTLGIVTDVTMRLVPKPKATAVALLYFASWEDATEAVLEARRLGASAIEAMDHTFLAFVRADRADLRPLIPERFDSSILVEFEGETAEEAHAGNGNVHVMPLLDPHDGTFQSRMAAMAEDAFELTWSLGGTITGEHGDGILRAPYLERQYPKAYAVMARVKHAMDPTGILNPGNVISDARTFPEGFSRYTNTYVETGTVFDEPEYRDMIEMCHGCGTCRDYCPVGSTTAL